jgi:hypothetical protein
VNRLIIVILLSFAPLTGCSSSEPELSYDPVELIEYEKCLNSPPSYAEGVWNLNGFAENFCKDKKPILK